MLHSSSNRATPVSADNITKLVRQSYKPVTVQEYNNEKVQCRTETTCQKSKPDDYWTSNFHRHQSNLQRGFYTSATEPYRPIGGELILDPSELVLSNFPGTANSKVNLRSARKGTSCEVTKSEARPSAKEKIQIDDENSSFTSLDLVDTAPSAGYDDIKKLLKESRHRLICVRAGKYYEDHVRAVEKANDMEKEANKPDDTGMVVRSVSSAYMATQNSKSQGSAQHGSGASSRRNSGKSDKVMMSDIIKTPSPVRPQSGRTTLKSPALKNKLTLIQVSTGITALMLRKERQIRDHLLYLQSIYRVLTALHNIKVRDIKSKVPLSKDVVERLQKENAREDDSRGSRGAYVSRVRGKQQSSYGFRGGYGSRRTSLAQSEVFSEFGDFDDTSPRKQKRKKTLLPKINQPTVSRRARKMSAVEKIGEELFGSAALAAFSRAARKVNLAEQVNKTLSQLRGDQRRSRNVPSISTERPALETWEDLLNVQPEPYKDDHHGGLAFQIGVLTKFMRWYRKCENEVAERKTEKRRASIIPTHIGGGGAGNIDKGQLSHLQEIHEKGAQGGDRDTHSQHPQQPGSTAQITDKVKKLPIWQQVAQEKSTVFQNLKQKTPNPEGVIHRFKKNLNKLKRSVQKESTATLEKMTRERMANFRLKFGALTCGECSPLFDEQKLKLLDVKDNVNKAHLDNFDVQPSKWYEELKERTNSLVSNHLGMIETLSKIQTYAHMDSKTVSYAKAKLCLLMMSLPAYDICQIYMQQALKFIFENILLGQEAQFFEWLNHRKIPNMVISDSQNVSNASPI